MMHDVLVSTIYRQLSSEIAALVLYLKMGAPLSIETAATPTLALSRAVQAYVILVSPRQTFKYRTLTSFCNVIPY